MKREDIIKRLNDQIKKRQEIVEKLEGAGNPCWSCGLTTNQLEHLTDWIEDWRNP